MKENVSKRLVCALCACILMAGIFLNSPVKAYAAGTTVFGGVDYAAVYDYDYYINRYADLKAAFGADANAAILHFVTYGMNEGRQGIDSFDVASYKNRYADLQNAFGDNNKAYYIHYMQFGRAEGRTATGGSAPQTQQQPKQQQTNTTQASGGSDQARAKLNEIGHDLRAAYVWSSNLQWTNQYSSPDAGTRAMANTGFTTGTGGCYVMAATFYEMARELGYDAHQMTGYVPRRGGGLAIHSWVEIVSNGVTYVVDPDFAYETGGNGYLIQYGQQGTWRYQSYSRMN